MKKHLLACTVAFLSLAWQWVQGQVFSDCISGITDKADICSFFIISLSCSLPPPPLTFVSLTLKAFEAALHWLPCIEVPGDLVLVEPSWEIISLTFDLLPSISLELKNKKLLRNPCHLVFALSVNPSPSLNPDILPHYLSLPAKIYLFLFVYLIFINIINK